MGFFLRIQIYGFMSASEQINYFFDLAYAVGKATTCIIIESRCNRHEKFTAGNHSVNNYCINLLTFKNQKKTKFSVSESSFIMWYSITLRSKVPPTDYNGFKCDRGSFLRESFAI
jgi:hypothetical protein